MNVIVSKFKEVLFSVLPITILILILHFTVSPIEPILVVRFFIGAFAVVIGLTIFLLGVDIGVTPFGGIAGTSLAKTNKLWVILVAGLILGFFISVAEPGLMVLANQVSTVTGGQISAIALLVTVSIGLAIMLAFGFLRIFYNLALYKVLIVLYLCIFGLSIFASRELFAISFDASGSTTGILAVPFILAMSVGISKLKKDSKASQKDSFGLISIASTGAIISVLLFDIFTKTNQFSSVSDTPVTTSESILLPFVNIMPTYLRESGMAILPLLVTLLVLQKLLFKLKKRELRKLLTGFAFALVGLFLFLVGVNGGFMDIGTSIGNTLVLHDNKALIVIIGFVLGVVTILAEPAVYVLTHQIEDVTSGYIKRKAVLIPLAIGVGLSVSLSVVRVLIPEIQLWHYLLPGYIISVVMMFFTPKLFVGIAFDTGGVATGPMTATFILAFIQGAANAFEGADLIVDGFGMVAMVAMTPIITLEVLGLVFAIKTRKKRRERE